MFTKTQEEIPFESNSYEDLLADAPKESTFSDKLNTFKTNLQHKLMGKKKISFAVDISEYEINTEEISKIVNFDQRNEPVLLEALANIGGIEGLARLLKTNLSSGLKLSYDQGSQIDLDTQKNTGKIVKLRKGISSVEDGAVRAYHFGKNIIDPPRTPTVFELIWEKIKQDAILKVLLAGSILSLVIGLIEDPINGWIDSIAIIIAVSLVAVVGSWNDYSKEKKFRKLLILQSAKKTKVIRNGKIDEISSWDLLVGDVVELSLGDEIPADGIFISGDNTVIDESPLTGESEPVPKNAETPFLFSGCQVSEGKGYMLVTTVGIRSTGGQIQAILSERQNNNTPLQEKLVDAANFIGKIALIAAVLTVIVLIIRWGVKISENNNEIANANSRINAQNTTLQQEKERFSDPAAIIFNNVTNSLQLDWTRKTNDLLQTFVLGVTILVVCMPDGLPLAVAMSLGFSMFKMMKEHCFVRQLAASETMGAATCICTDKTGTLTENRMSVVKVMAGKKILHGTGSGEDDSKEYSPETFEAMFKDLVCEGISVNSSCFIKINEKDGRPMFIGNSTEGSLLILAEKLGVSYQEERSATTVAPNGLWLFDSTRKKMSTMIIPKGVGYPAKPGSLRLHTKGASEIILDLCTSYLDPNGEDIHPMTPEYLAKFNDIVKRWASEGLRTFALAFRDFFENPRNSTDAEYAANPENDLTLICLCGIKDPVRAEVPHAVKECQKAGLIVRMVTGDNILTACKIAKECNILNKNGVALEGPKFRAMSKEDKMKIIPKLQVLARSSPYDKYVLVSLLKEMGEVVAVTGDGTNDAPALKEADVGFAMGISGTQIAINASDIVLMKDNFVSVVAAIRYGRNVLNCVRKFLQFQLSINIVATLMTFISAAAGEKPYLNSAQLLWINLIMDALGALALASDPPDANILDQPPQRRTEFILSKEMLQHIGAMTVFQLVILVTMYYQIDHLLYSIAPQLKGLSNTSKMFVAYKGTVLATTFVIMQLVNQFMCRQLHNEYNMIAGAFSNRIFIGILVLIAVIQIIMVEVGYDLFQMLPMNALSWLLCTGLSLVLVPAIFFSRFLGKKDLKLMNSRHKQVNLRVASNNDINFGSQVLRGSQMFLDRRQSQFVKTGSQHHHSYHHNK